MWIKLMAVFVMMATLIGIGIGMAMAMKKMRKKMMQRMGMMRRKQGEMQG